MNFPARFFGHLHTINSHRRKVFAHCCRAGIPWQGLRHDLSKYSPTEFCNGVRYFQGNRSPNDAEREDIGYSSAWMHHKGRNRHHFEYWVDYHPVTRTQEPVKMPVKYVAEMFCDRVAAGKIYMKKNYTNDAPLQYFLKAKGRRIIHPETSDLLESWLTLLAEQGEDAAFAAIRAQLRNEKQNRKRR